MVYTNTAYLANLGRVGEIALCQHSRPDVAARLAGHQRSSKVRVPCHVIGTLLGIGCYARVTAPRTNRALHTLELTYEEIRVVKLCNSLAKWKHTKIVSYYVNLIIILKSHPILSWNLVTQMWNIIVKYPGTFRYTVCRNHYETIKKRQK